MPSVESFFSLSDVRLPTESRMMNTLSFDFDAAILSHRFARNVLTSDMTLTGTAMSFDVSTPILPANSLSHAPSESSTMTVYPFFCASLAIDAARYDLPAPDSPASIIDLLLGRPPNNDPDTAALSIYDPVPI